MGYIVDYDELFSIEQKVESKTNQWLSVLDETRKNVTDLASAESIQGDLADSVSSYLGEVHDVALVSIISALDMLRTRFCLYWYGYKNQIDSDIHAHIREIDLERVRGYFAGIIEGVTDVDEEMSRALRPISDLLYLTAPSPTTLLDALDEVRNRCRKLGQKITEFEESHASSDFEEIDGIITNVQKLLDSQMGDKRVSVRNYQPSMVAAMTDVAALQHCLQSIQEYKESVKDELAEALECEQETLQKLEDERRWVKLISAGVCVLGTVILLAATAGGATPLVCAGIGAAAGLASAAANGFTDNYIVTGSLTEGMDWVDFGKECVIGTVAGAITGAAGALAHGSAVVKPMEKAMMGTAEGMVKNGSTGLINFVFDVGAAVAEDGSTFESILTAANDSVEDMMKNVLVGMAADATGGYFGGINDASSVDKGFWQTLGEKTIENMAENEAKIGAGVTVDVLTGVSSGKNGVEILNMVDFDMRDGTQAFIKDEFGSALSGGFDATIDGKIKGDSTGVKVLQGTFKAANKAVNDTAGTITSKVTEQALSGQEVDMGKIWREDLDGGFKVLESAGKSAAKSATDEMLKEKKFQDYLKDRDYDHDGRVEVITFKNFSGYSVLKEDYDAAIEMAGERGYEGKRAQDILGVPRNVSFSEDNVEIHKYKPTSLKKSDYSGQGSTNAVKVEHK